MLECFFDKHYHHYLHCSGGGGQGQVNGQLVQLHHRGHRGQPDQQEVLQGLGPGHPEGDWLRWGDFSIRMPNDSEISLNQSSFSMIQSNHSNPAHPGVSKIMVTGTSLHSTKEALRLTRLYPDVLYSTAGIKTLRFFNHCLSSSTSPFPFCHSLPNSTQLTFSWFRPNCRPSCWLSPSLSENPQILEEAKIHLVNDDKIRESYIFPLQLLCQFVLQKCTQYFISLDEFNPEFIFSLPYIISL